MPTLERAKLSPPAVARRYGIATNKVLAWIRSGELRAINGATTLGTRPRYLIDVADLAAFEQRRSAVPTVQPRRRKNRAVDNVTEFF